VSAAKKSGSIWRWLIALVILIAAGAGVYVWKGKNTTEVVYRTAQVERGDLRISVLATGTVQPENRLEIKPPVAGRIDSVLVEEGQHVTKGQLLAWISSTERAALLDAARSQGVDEVKKWEELYRATPVLAPITGTIILRNVESGQTFSNTDPILVMSDRLTIKAQVDETDIAKIKLKQKAEVTLDAYSTDKIPAVVEQIAFEAKTVNNVTTYVIDVLPLKIPPFMRSGMTANVSFVVDSKDAILLVPSDAIKTHGDSSSILIPDEKGNPVEHPIKTGLTDGHKTEVVSGLTENEKILIAQYKLQPSGNKPGANPFGPAAPPRRAGGGH
jgi:macrolide-specific efflux system membrane fusion protein